AKGTCPGPRKSGAFDPNRRRHSHFASLPVYSFLRSELLNGPSPCRNVYFRKRRLPIDEGRGPIRGRLDRPSFRDAARSSAEPADWSHPAAPLLATRASAGEPPLQGRVTRDYA